MAEDPSQLENATRPGPEDEGEGGLGPEDEQPSMEGVEGQLEDDLQPQEFVDKEFIARPYDSQTLKQTVEEVKMMSVTASRPPIRIRISKKRKEFDGEYNFTDKDGGDNVKDSKPQRDPNYNVHRKVLDLGIQAGRKMIEFASQTYYNRMVNNFFKYDAGTVIDEYKSIDSELESPEIEKFLDKVSFLVEEALQSNELINVFQDDFEMLAEDDGGSGGSKISSNLRDIRNMSDLHHSAKKKVTCIRFHPSNPELVAESVVENLSFMARTEIAGKSHSSMLLVWNFMDTHFMSPVYLLETPIEISTFEFHPENANIIIGGTISGQLIVWNFNDPINKQSRLNSIKKPATSKGGGGGKEEKLESEVLTHYHTSSILLSHKSAVTAIRFVPPTIKVQARHGENQPGPHSYMISVAEDGIFLIWDLYMIEKDTHIIQEIDSDFIWKPIFQLRMLRPDGSGELGMSHCTFTPDQATPTFWSTSDEGELLQVDWSIRAQDEAKTENVRIMRDDVRSYRPCLGLQVSPFFQDLILTLHDFNFVIWKNDLDTPIFKSANCSEQSHHITCGCWSPTRPGVIFVGKTSGQINIWDFLDQSHKPSIEISLTSQSITYLQFQEYPLPDKKQHLAIADDNGALVLYEVRSTLKHQVGLFQSKQGDEVQAMQSFWDREIMKCNYVKERKAVRAKELEEILVQKQADEQAAQELNESKVDDEAINIEEMKAEIKYQEQLLKTKEEFGLISQEEADKKRKELKIQLKSLK